MHCGGGLAICGWGGRWKRWRGYDDGVVGRWMDSLGACPSLRAQPSMLTPASVILPLTGGVQQECGTVLRKASTTTTPNHPHTLIRYMSGEAQGWSEQSRRLGNRRITQPIGGRTYGAGEGRRTRVAHPYKEGTPHRGLGDQSPDGTGRRIAQWRDRIDRWGASGRTVTPRWLGAAGLG